MLSPFSFTKKHCSLASLQAKIMNSNCQNVWFWDTLYLKIFPPGRHSSYCPSYSKPPRSPSEERPETRTQSQYFDFPAQNDEQIHQSHSRKHSPNCHRHHRHRSHRHHHSKHMSTSEDLHPNTLSDVAERTEELKSKAYQHQSGLFSMDVEYGYNYTRVGRYNIGLTFS